MENDDDPRLKCIQEFLRRSPEAIAPMNHMRAILRAVSAAAPDKRAGILMRASKMAMPPVTAGEVNQLLAEFPTPAAAQGYLRSLAEMAKETERKADEIGSQARRAFASQLKDLKSEADLTWDNIATESGILKWTPLSRPFLPFNKLMLGGVLVLAVGRPPQR